MVRYGFSCIVDMLVHSYPPTEYTKSSVPPSSHTSSATQRLEVNIDSVLNRAGIAAGHGDRHRQAGLAAILEHQLVALGQAALGERQPPKLVVGEGIGAGQIDRQVGAR